MIRARSSAAFAAVSSPAMAAAMLLGVAMFSAPADAFPTMVRHGYASCQACHVDPSGGGQLTAYGRAQSDLLVGWHLDPKVIEEGEPSPATGFLWGLLETPEFLNVSGNVRGGALYNTTTAGAGAGLRPLLMAADVYGTVNVESFVAHVAVGYGARAVGPAVVISDKSGPDNALVAREFWAGARFVDDQLTIRAGRIPMPFGLRNNEHTSLVRSLTRTDNNIHQQTGIAASWNSESWRGEVMLLAGNYQIRPDAFRERGGAGFFEWAFAPELTLGASSLVSYAAADLEAGVPNLRQAHGAFLRWAPTTWMAILAEGDAVINYSSDVSYGVGGVGWLQADIEPWQGVHFIPAVEAGQVDANAALPTMGAWMSVSWFALPHTELRLDSIYRQVSPKDLDSVGSFTALAQVHFFL